LLLQRPPGYPAESYAYSLDGYATDIYARRVYTGGYSGSYSLGSTISVISGSTLSGSRHTQSDPSVSINSSNNFVVSYTEYGWDLGSSQVFAQRFNSANIYLGQVSVGGTDTRAEFGSSVSLDNNGRFIVAYTHFYGGNDYDVLAEVFNWDNKVWFPSLHVAYNGYQEYSPTVALGMTNLTSNYSGNGYYDGQAIFGFETSGLKSNLNTGSNGTGVAAARAYDLNGEYWLNGVDA
jgi:hypothetical protein